MINSSPSSCHLPANKMNEKFFETNIFIYSYFQKEILFWTCRFLEYSILSNLMEMSIEHDGRPLTRLIVGLEKYLIELTAGSVVHSYFLLTCSLTDLSFSNVRIFFMHRWEIKGIARNFDQFFMTNGLEKLTDILITTSIAINLHQATHPQVCILLLHGSILHTNRIPMSKRAYYMASLTADEWF